MFELLSDACNTNGDDHVEHRQFNVFDLEFYGDFSWSLFKHSNHNDSNYTRYEYYRPSIYQ